MRHYFLKGSAALKLLCILGLIFSSIAISHRAEAQEYSEFLFCDNCTSSAQFKQVALARPTVGGEYLYAVGNRITGVMHHVRVTYTPAGQDPWAHVLNFENPAVVEYPVSDPNVIAAEKQNVRTLSGRTGWATPGTSAENNFFAAMVSATKNRIVVSSPSNIIGFDSLAGAQYEVIGPYLHTAMSAKNPGWTGQNIMGALVQKLLAALGATGKTPIACLIFTNGDIGCFQLHPASAIALVYINGTGKDRHGNPISRTPNMPNTGGVSTRIHNVSGGYGYSLVGAGNSYISCGYINGKLHSCHVMSE